MSETFNRIPARCRPGQDGGCPLSQVYVDKKAIPLSHNCDGPDVVRTPEPLVTVKDGEVTSIQQLTMADLARMACRNRGFILWHQAQAQQDS